MPRALKFAAAAPRFTVDSPENTMAVIRAATRLLHDRTIREITCFQCNSMGDDKLMNPGTRPSVMGGSLLDKAPRAVAWCCQLLAPTRVARWSARVRRGGQAFVLLPAILTLVLNA